MGGGACIVLGEGREAEYLYARVVRRGFLAGGEAEGEEGGETGRLV